MHVHRWTSRMHLDSCHSFQTTYSCGCGATAISYGERDVSDPWTAIWMEPVLEVRGRDERGRFVKPHVEEVVCFRCRELQSGAKPRHYRELLLADGTSWVDERR